MKLSLDKSCVFQKKAVEASARKKVTVAQWHTPQEQTIKNRNGEAIVAFGSVVLPFIWFLSLCHRALSVRVSRSWDVSLCYVCPAPRLYRRFDRIVGI